MCLFDECMLPSAVDAYDHMRRSHGFDLRRVRQDLGMHIRLRAQLALLYLLSLLIGLDFYQSIKLINYIRKQTSLCRCYSCGATYNSIDAMTAHMERERHFSQVPNRDASFWNDPQYVFDILV